MLSSTPPGLLSEAASSRSLNSGGLGPSDFAFAGFLRFGDVLGREDAARLGFEVDFQLVEVAKIVGQAGRLGVEHRVARAGREDIRTRPGRPGGRRSWTHRHRPFPDRGRQPFRPCR